MKDRLQTYNKARRFWRYRLIHGLIRFTFYLYMVIASAVFLIGAVEMIVRGLHAGQSNHLMEQRSLAGSAYYVSNRAFYQQFFSLPLDRMAPWDDLEAYVPVSKPVNAYRIFIFGGSAAAGLPPDALASFPRMLAMMLQESFPDKQVEVYTLAAPGCSSHVMRAAAAEAARLKPDLFIVYMGNNEFVGPFGMGRGALTDFIVRHDLVRPYLFLKNLRLVQMLSLFQQRNVSSAVADENDIWSYLRGLDPGDPRTGLLYESFAKNLASIAEVGHENGFPVLFSTVAVNLSGWAPMYGVNSTALSETELRQWQQYFADGVEQYRNGRYQEALTQYEAAAALDDSHAVLHFGMGRCLEKLKQTDAAWDEYLLARDLDRIASRANSRINEIIREVASQCHMPVEDAARRFEIQGRSGQATDDQWFYDNVHLTPEGNHQLAGMFYWHAASVLLRRGGSNAVPSKQDDLPEPLNLETCKKRLALAPEALLTHLETVQKMHAMLAQVESPFQVEQLETLRHRRTALLRQHESAETLDSAYEWAVQAWPGDYLLRKRQIAHLLQQGGNEHQAATAAEEAHIQFPYRRDMRRLWLQALLAAGRTGEALEVGEALLALFPDDGLAWHIVGKSKEQTGETKQALKHYQRAWQLSLGTLTRAQQDAARLLFQEGQNAEAIQAYLAMLRQDPQNPALYDSLNSLLENAAFPQILTEGWRRVCEVLPESPWAWHYLGLAHASAKDTPQARSCFEKALSCCSGSVPKSVQERKDAHRDGARSIASGEHNPLFYLNFEERLLRGRLLSQLGQYPEAIAAFCAAMERDENRYEPFNELESLLPSSVPDIDRLDFWEGIAARHPDSARASFHLAQARKNKGDWQGAATAFADAVNGNPGDPAMQVEYGMALLQVQQIEAGLNALGQALQINPELHHIREQGVATALDAGDCVQAHTLLEQAPQSFSLSPLLQERMQKECAFS